MILEALKPVFNNGMIVEVGDKFSCSPDYADKLIKSESATVIKETDSERKSLEAKKKEELLKLAEEEGIDSVSEKNKKEEIIDALLEVAD